MTVYVDGEFRDWSALEPSLPTEGGARIKNGPSKSGLAIRWQHTLDCGHGFDAASPGTLGSPVYCLNARCNDAERQVVCVSGYDAFNEWAYTWVIS